MNIPSTIKLDLMVRPLGPADLSALHGLRLEALMRNPEADGGDFAQEAQMAPQSFARAFLPAAPGMMIGSFAGAQLVGMAGLSVSALPSRRHKGIIFGCYVQPLHRKSGLAGEMLENLIAQARAAGLYLLTASVTVGTDPAARRLFLSRRFKPYGIALRSLVVGAYFRDEELLQLDLDSSDANTQAANQP